MIRIPRKSADRSRLFARGPRFVGLLLLGLVLYPWTVQIFTRLVVELTNAVVVHFSPPVQVEILPDETVRYVEQRADGTRVQTVVFSERGFTFAGVGVAILPALLLGTRRLNGAGIGRLASGFLVLLCWQTCTAIVWAMAAGHITDRPEQMSAEILFYTLTASPHLGVVITWGLLAGRHLLPRVDAKGARAGKLR